MKKTAWFSISCLLLSNIHLAEGKASEYQLESESLSQCESLRGQAVAKQQDHVPHCSEDGRFSHVQCLGGGRECWCVDGEGTEIMATRSNNSVLNCQTPCQLQRQRMLMDGEGGMVPRCQASGDFESVQCDSSRAQCWCVDVDGMELYGTRQNKRPSQCPNSCEVRERRLLHAAMGRSPPQCSDKGSFLPVQCKFINMTDGMEMDLLHNFNRFPDAFQTFSRFRQTFPSVSSYCYCADSRGRELPSTGLELLLAEVYDTAFSGLSTGPSFTQSNIYRVLQRRLLGLRLALTGRFRCPTACESERSAALQAASVFVPSCGPTGDYSPKQCQAGGQCWCVNRDGREISGTRQQGDTMDCSAELTTCPSQRRQALVRLFFGPLNPPPPTSSLTSLPMNPCSPQMRRLRQLLLTSAELESTDAAQVVEVLQGLFPSASLALQALTLASPSRLQENLFGGKFLKNAAMFNFTGAVGDRGTLSFKQAFNQLGLMLERDDPVLLAQAMSSSGSQQLDLDQNIVDAFGRSVNLKENQRLAQRISRALENPDFLTAFRHILLSLSNTPSATLEEVLASLLTVCHTEPEAMFVPSCTASGQFQEEQCHGPECWCVDPQGQEVTGSRATGRRPRCPSQCARERALALSIRANQAAGAELYIPKCAENGRYHPLQCLGQQCFCLDGQGNRQAALPAGGAVTCPLAGSSDKMQTLKEKIQTPGPCSLALSEVTTFRQETERIILLSNSSHLPLGYGFILAEGLRLTQEELLTSQSHDEELISDRLLSNSDAALRLAAYSTLLFYRGQQRRTSLRLDFQPYTPQCDAHEQWMPTQCYPSTGHCWCVDEEGTYIPGSLTVRSPRAPKCLSKCQRAHVHNLLSGWTSGSGISTTSSYRAQCEESGLFSMLQREGARALCVSPVTGEVLQDAALSPAGELTCQSWCEFLAGLVDNSDQKPQCQPDGTFSPLQCDITSCWCVSNDGQEVPESRSPRSTGKTPACNQPQCPGLLTHGALLCDSTATGSQSCQLFCHHGYQNALPISRFLCDVDSRTWVMEAPLSGACQRSHVFQTLQKSVELQVSLSEDRCPSLATRLQTNLLSKMATSGLCSIQQGPLGPPVPICDDSSVRVECGPSVIRLKVTWKAALADFTTPDLPDPLEIDLSHGEVRVLRLLQGLLASGPAFLQLSLTHVASLTKARFGCFPGYQPGREATGCVVCPAGSFSSGEACHLCPQGTYQRQEGQDACITCPKDTSTAASGASSVTQCLTECQRSGLRCSERGGFLLAQPDSMSTMWRCGIPDGFLLDWTTTKEPLSEEECTVLGRFEAVSTSALVVGAGDAEVLISKSSDIDLTSYLKTCVQACAEELSCHHVALFTEGGRTHCELYSTHTSNTVCNTSEQARGFLANPEAVLFDQLSCSMKVKGQASDLLVVRKKGQEFDTQHQKRFEKLKFRKAVSGVFRTLVFPSEGSTLTDAHRFCQDQCSRDTCCDGFILNQNVLNGGTLLCGLLSPPAVLLCGDKDWDVMGLATARRLCGAGLSYNKQQKSFVFNFGGQEFTITDAALPISSKNKTDYQATIIGFQAIYLHTESAPAGPRDSSSCSSTQPNSTLILPLTSASVQESFEALEASTVVIDPQRNPPALTFWLSKLHFTTQQAQLWCLQRCEEESQCSTVDVHEDRTDYFTCSLYPDSRVCGAYDKPLRAACSPVLSQQPHNAFTKKVDLSGPVESFYTRVPFKKMVSYSVRSRVSLGATPLNKGFVECERTCDEDPCCRGIGFVRDTKSPGGPEVVCLQLISLGIQTCGENDTTTWRSQDCSPSVVQTNLYPFGWYQKPVNQWTSSPALCPHFDLRAPSKNVSLHQWALLDHSSVVVDPALSSYDVVHISQDIATDPDRTRDWCLAACEMEESCVAVAVSQVNSATRCVLYPDTRACGLGPASRDQLCRLVLKEPSTQVYLLRNISPSSMISVLIPGHGMLQGTNTHVAVGAGRKTVNQYLGIPYARPPIGALRFSSPQPTEWTGTWNASMPKASCLQPGDLESSSSSEDCLYLNIFVPSTIRGSVPVLVFFYNPSSSSSQGPGLLDASFLAAVGDMIVVTVNYRTAALGFLSTGTTDLPGNYGLQDQVLALSWVRDHISLVGGDSRRLTVGAERRGADMASLHLLTPSTPPLFQRMLLMGGSLFSPAVVQSVSSAKRQVEDLARELGCLTSDTNLELLASCLRDVSAHTLNAAQTKLLSVRGPLQAWGPVVDGMVVPQKPSVALQAGAFHKADLLLGSSQQDGLISRARNIKNFEALQGRVDGKTAFYEALTNSLGGEEANALVKEAATWFYSMQHSPTPAGYSVFSRALENATRDLFIVCPTLRMANWAASSKSKVFLYHLPDATAHTSVDTSVPLDVQYVFGVPHQPISSERFTSTDRQLSLGMMTYVSNFIKTGDPNRAQASSRVEVLGAALPPWSSVPPQPAPLSYKEMEAGLRERLGLRTAQCSFWSDYIPKLAASTAQLFFTELEKESDVQPTLTAVFPAAVTPIPSQTGKDAYS